MGRHSFSMLGNPTTRTCLIARIDRVSQQANGAMLSGLLDPTFSDKSVTRRLDLASQTMVHEDV